MILKIALTAAVSVPDVAVRVSFVPFLSILQPVKVATPRTAFVPFAVPVQVRLADPVGGVMATVTVTVTVAVLVVTVLPPASWMVTPGWVANGLFIAAPEGCPAPKKWGTRSETYHSVDQRQQCLETFVSVCRYYC